MDIEEKRRKNRLSVKKYMQSEHGKSVRRKYSRMLSETGKQNEYRNRWASKESGRKKINEMAARYREKYKEEIRERSKIRNTKESYKIWLAEYRKRNKERFAHRIRISNEKRRSRCIKTDITFQWAKLLSDSTKVCECCGKELLDDAKYPDNKELDHIIPLSIGGKHLMNNVRYICGFCNRSRPKDGRDVINKNIAV